LAGRRRYRVAWSESATHDLLAIVAYLAARSPTAARRVLHDLRLEASGLATLPLRGRHVPELAELGVRAWREVIVPPYRLVYRVANRDVRVVLVVDGRRELENLLVDRLLREG